MIRIALVEDDLVYVKELVEYLKRYEEESKTKIRVSVFPDGEDIIENYQANFDVILMDVEMQFMDGMTAAARIRETDSEVVIIFITNMPQYALKGYQVEALDYVLKPVSYFAFSQRIDRALTRMKKRTGQYLTVPIKGGKKKFDISKIYYVEVQDHDLIFHTISGEYLAKGSMKDIEETLIQQGFFRCHRCYLVNLEYVEHFQSVDVIVAGDTIQVSRSRKKMMLDALNNYMNEVGK
ncbi:LytTR family DNA-binding domain-containing protein [Lachnospiraceae bacterium PAL113]|uniref:Stage 0 sporulation protein A homolog n=2 Tax=Aequitasia blattaphilus TaxID=2949332 RepID=A0ABT1EBM6_9FIRM|nr:LytTR family DNA-binding domain-containing protein [Aequitasia blattaphilus]MCP1103225.1 LytTR family DNA-binding domain-containing protein [Aequitasia blattaphilus]MCR8615865.1 LytTR family DNA-binding domain-containing protein [Aequitasia blattaphilus]